MNKFYQIAKSTFRFRRWSRKNYAAFVSIGRFFTIGFLSKTVIEKALLKQGKFFQNTGNEKKENNPPKEKPAEEEFFKCLWDILYSIFGLQVEKEINTPQERVIDDFNVTNCGIQVKWENSR